MRTPRPWILPVEPATWEHLLAGASVAMLRTQLAAGRLIRVRRGVYLAAESWPQDPSGQHVVLAHAEQVVNGAAVLSHGTAALAWDLPHPRVRPVVRRAGDTDGAGGRRATNPVAGERCSTCCRCPPPTSPRDRSGYPITTMSRTAVDVAAGLPLPEALVVLDAAARMLCQSLVVGARRRDFANPRLVKASRDLLVEAARVRGIPRLRLAISHSDPGRESPAESLSAGWFALAQLPMPLFQPPVDTPFGTLYPDCLWPERRLVGECDGAVKYSDSAGYVREKEREQVLHDLGYRIVRWLAKEIMTDPQRVVDRVARALQS